MGETMVTIRKGLGKGMGCGYKNMLPNDKLIHGLSAKGVKTYKSPSIITGNTYICDNLHVLGIDLSQEQYGKVLNFATRNPSLWSSMSDNEKKQTIKEIKSINPKELNAKGSLISTEMATKFTKEQLNALRILQYQYYPSQNQWSLKWSKKPSELFVLEK